MKIFVEMDASEYEEFKAFKNRMPEQQLYDPDDIKRSIIRDIKRYFIADSRDKQFNPLTGEETVVALTSFEFRNCKVTMREIIEEKR